MAKRPFTEYFTGTVIRLFNFFAKNGFPLATRIFFHRLRGVKIGQNCFIGSNVYLDNKNPRLIKIGNGVGIATGVIILVHRRDIHKYSINKRYNDYPFLFKPVIIEDNCQIGVNAIILPGVNIGKGSIIAAGSTVTRDIPMGSLAAGTPAKIIKNLIN